MTLTEPVKTSRSISPNGTPSKVIEPVHGWYNPEISLASVDLPHPDLPTIAIFCPDLMDREKFEIKGKEKSPYEIENVISQLISDPIKKSEYLIEKLGYGKFPVCIAKTQYSFSDERKMVDDKINKFFTDALKDALEGWNRMEFHMEYE